MKTFIFNTTYTCPYTNEFKVQNNLEYRASDQESALSGMKSYCESNKNRLNCKAVLVGELSFTGSFIAYKNIIQVN